MFRLIDWRRGRPAELWARSERIIMEFIEKNRLKAVSEDYLDPVSAMAGGVITDGKDELLKEAILSSIKEVGFRWPVPFPGGLKGPHVHFQKDVYFLNGDQWREFANLIVKDIQERLSRANEIGFQELVEITEATSGLA